MQKVGWSGRRRPASGPLSSLKSVKSVQTFWNKAGWAVLIAAMTEHADHRFSATLSTPDLALIECLQALAKLQPAKHLPQKCTRDWRAAGQKVIFGFSGSWIAIFS